MPRMIDLIRVSALPSNVMQAASKGSLSVPANEMIEILVYLATHNKIFGQQAQLTLAGAAGATASPAVPAVTVVLVHLSSATGPLLPLSSVEQPGEDDILDEDILSYLSEHAGEISAEGNKEFQPIGGFYDEFVPGSDKDVLESETAPPSTSSEKTAAAPKKAPAGKKQHLSHEEERGSALQKISKLDIKGRIQLAMKGTKEERSLLVRDGTKVVALAVLESPKISDAEVERFATQKNVLEAVLRAIPMKRRFVKNYAVVRNLTCNPRTPLDVSLSLIKHLLITDLRHLSGNKEVSETVRKLALKMFKQKLESGSKRS